MTPDGNSSSKNQHRQCCSMQVMMFVTLIIVLLHFLSEFVSIPKDAPADVIGKQQQMQHLQQQEQKQEQQQQQGQEKCISLADDGNLDRMLAEVDLVYIVMPPKTGSTTIGVFKANCLGMKFDNQQLDHLEELISDEREIPPFVTQRISKPKSLIQVVRQSIQNSLIIYYYRDDTERLGSAIRQVIVRSLINAKPDDNKNDNSGITLNISEEDVLAAIKRGAGEIGQSGASLLTCDTYHAIEDSAPNYVFLHYTQSDKLMRLLAKNNCPDYTTWERVNEGGGKPTVMVKSKNWKKPMNLNDWIPANLNILEHHFELKPEGFCQAETRRMTHNLLACPDQGLHYSSADFYTPADTLIAKKTLP